MEQAVKIEGRIASYTVLKDSISVQFICTGTDSVATEKLLSIKDKTEHFTIGNMGTTGSVKSVNLRKVIHFLLHLPRTVYVAKNLFTLMESDIVPVMVNSSQEQKLLCLLNKAAIIKGVSQPELLHELTSFTGKNGKPVAGKDTICNLSPRFQEVVISKLFRIIKTNEEGNHVRGNQELVERRGDQQQSQRGNSGITQGAEHHLD